MPEIPPELLDKMTPAARAFVEVLLLRIAELEKRNAELEKRNAELEKRVEELEAKLAKNSRNSSRPPSSEHPHAKPLPQKKPKSKRKQGGQRGHQKFERTPIAKKSFPANRINVAVAARRFADVTSNRCGSRSGMLRFAPSLPSTSSID